jgi:peptidoglycan/xylan/chitin deacetylase (PgdA/CDA1 family)
MTDPAPMEPWTFPEEKWRFLVNRVRAGRRLAPTSWKGGARMAVALSFDSDHETSELKEGGGSIGRLAWGQYGNRVGIPRIEALLKKYDIPASFYVPAVTALLHPDEQRRLIDAGHEIGIHGWIHERQSELSRQNERELMLRALDTIEKVVGIRPTGLRSPSADFSENTLDLMVELGLEYDSSLGADDDCYELESFGKKTGIVEMPFEWVRDDAVYFMMNRWAGLRPYTPPEAVLDIWKRELIAAYESGGIFELTMHPHIITYRSRIWILEELIRYARSLPGVWFARHDEVARYAKENAA